MQTVSVFIVVNILKIQKNSKKYHNTSSPVSLVAVQIALN